MRLEHCWRSLDQVLAADSKVFLAVALGSGGHGMALHWQSGDQGSLPCFAAVTSKPGAFIGPEWQNTNPSECSCQIRNVVL